MNQNFQYHLHKAMHKIVIRSIVIILAFFFLPMISAYAQMKRITGEPVNIGVLLVNQNSLDEMIETCEYYNMTPQAMDDNGYTVYKHPDGSTIRFKVSVQEDKTFPIVKITTKKKSKDIEKILTELRFKKTDNGYETSGRLVRTHCQLDNKTLIFTKVYL